MTRHQEPSIDFLDFLIVGSGIAGLRAAIALAPHGRVQILTKAAATESNTGYAQGGIAAAIDPADSPAQHAADTIRAGDGLCDAAAVAVLVEDGPRYVRELIEWGVRFDRDANGRPALALEAVHSFRRVLHAGDATGREIARALWHRASTMPNVDTVNHALVTQLIVEDGVVRGVRYFDNDGAEREARAAATSLATGGAGQVFRETTNPGVATGDGVALAYHAGARVADLEFVQFHPTALNVQGAPRFLISEAIRGEGARLVNAAGEPFMSRYHPDGDLAPRDVVARSIARESIETRGPIFLSLAHLPGARIRERFPTIADMCRQVGLDLATDRIPVGPAAHYLMGGIDTDEWGRSSLPGLFAAGEAACTGVHGANRLASNSLLEGLVFGARAAEAMMLPPQAAPMKSDRRDADSGGAELPPSASAKAPADKSPRLQRTSARPKAPGGASSAPPPVLMETAAVRNLMWESAGLFRTREALEDATARLDAAYDADLRLLGPRKLGPYANKPGPYVDTREAMSVASGTRGHYTATPAESPASVEDWRRFNLVTVARLIARAALRREESRGGHFRADFPTRDDLHWKVHLTETRDTYGQ